MKPRLTAKVMDGLTTIAGQMEAGDSLGEGGELEEVADEVTAALRWIRAMQRHRAEQRGASTEPHTATPPNHAEADWESHGHHNRWR